MAAIPRYNEFDLKILEMVRKKILEDISIHYSIEDLARYAQMNSYKLKLGFKKQYGSPIYKYLEKARLERAVKLLENGGYDINEIAELVGYTFATNFIVAFKRAFGVTPLHYKPRSEHYQEKVIMAANVIHARLDEHHTLASLSRYLSIPKDKLLAGFKTKYGASPYGYLQQKRMEKTKELLSVGVSALDILPHVGYDDVRNLNNAFKTAYGKTMTQWKSASVI